MGYMILGFIVGAVSGVFTMALVSVNKITKEVKPKAEREIYMGTCSLGATHNVLEVDKDEDR